MSKKTYGGQSSVNYFALVPQGYDARLRQRHGVEIIFKEKIRSIESSRQDFGMLVSELVRIILETDTTAEFFPNHVCTDTGRWIHRRLIRKNPRKDDILIIRIPKKTTKGNNTQR